MKNRVLVLNYLITLFLLLASCRKISHDTDVSGTVYESGIHQPMRNVAVNLLEEDNNCFACPNPFTVIKSTNTDENGNFSFDFKASKGHTYSLSAKKDNYFDFAGGNIYIDVDKNNKGVVLHLIPYAYLKLHVKNINPLNGLDRFALSYSYLSYVFYGTNVDTIFKIAVNTPLKGNEVNILPYFINRDGIETSYKAEIYCNAFDTTNYSINY